MIDLAEHGLRRALDDTLATCWTDEIPILDAIAEAVTDWTAQAEAELNASEAFEPQKSSHHLTETLAAMSTAVEETRGIIPGRTLATALTEALRDWSAGPTPQRVNSTDRYEL
jgi:hypothetical protein